MWYLLLLQELIPKIIIAEQHQASYFLCNVFSELQSISILENKFHIKTIMPRINQLIVEVNHGQPNQAREALQIIFHLVATHYLPKEKLLADLNAVKTELEETNLMFNSYLQQHEAWANKRKKALEYKLVKINSCINKINGLPTPLLVPGSALFGLIDKMFTRYENKPNNSVKLRDFIKDLFALSLIYMKAGIETTTFNSELNPFYVFSAFQLMGLIPAVTAEHNFLGLEEVQAINTLEHYTLVELQYNIEIDFEHVFYILINHGSPINFAKILETDFKYLLRRDDMLCNLIVKIKTYNFYVAHCKKIIDGFKTLGLVTEAQHMDELIHWLKDGIGSYDEGAEDYHDTRTELTLICDGFVKFCYFDLLYNALEQLYPARVINQIMTIFQPLLKENTATEATTNKIKYLQKSVLYSLLPALKKNKVLTDLALKLQQHIQQYIFSEENRKISLMAFKSNCLKSTEEIKRTVKNPEQLNTLIMAIKTYGMPSRNAFFSPLYPRLKSSTPTKTNVTTC